MKITLRQIEIFAAIADTENVSRAADRLAMSQSAASNALVELERSFDRPLFDRVGKSLQLNAHGRGLLPLAANLLAQARGVEAFLQGSGQAPIRVGATLTIGNYLATLLVAAYQREFPGARIDLQVANTATVLDRLRRFECDLALIESETSDPEFVTDPWLDDQLVVFCAPGDPLARSGAAGNSQLAAARWIVREHGSATRAQFDARVAAALPKIDIGLELEHTEAIKRAVESGLGIGCLSRLALREAFRRGSLVEIPTPQIDLTRRFYFAMHRQTDAGETGARFRALCLRATQGATSSADIALPFIP